MKTKVVYITEMYSSNRTYTNCFKHINDVCKYIRKRYNKNISIFVFRMNVKLVNKMTNKELSKILTLRIAQYKKEKTLIILEMSIFGLPKITMEIGL